MSDSASFHAPYNYDVAALLPLCERFVARRRTLADNNEAAEDPVLRRILTELARRCGVWVVEDPQLYPAMLASVEAGTRRHDRNAHAAQGGAVNIGAMGNALLAMAVEAPDTAERDEAFQLITHQITSLMNVPTDQSGLAVCASQLDLQIAAIHARALLSDVAARVRGVPRPAAPDPTAR
jgi:hypothetical protein